MKTYLECVPCFVRQALDASRMVTDNPEVHERVLRETLRLSTELRFDQPPPWMGCQIHRLLKEATGNEDPYAQAKAHSNSLALSLLPELKTLVNNSKDSFNTALRLAIAGNIIDFGCKTKVTDEDVQCSIDSALNDPLDNNMVQSLKNTINQSEDILYLTDNAGEIILDRLLIEQMPAERVTVVVKGAPIINDATYADAEIAGLTSLVKVIDNGTDIPGTILEQCPTEFQKRFSQADLVISKGQGNYETLSHEDGNIFFLLKAKCPVIARDIGCRVGELVVCQGPHK